MKSRDTTAMARHERERRTIAVLVAMPALLGAAEGGAGVMAGAALWAAGGATQTYAFVFRRRLVEAGALEGA